MAVKTTAIVEGNVIRADSRSFKTKAGEDMTIDSVLIVGQFCIANVRVDTRTFKLPDIGKPIRIQVEVDTYRDDDQMALVAYL